MYWKTLSMQVLFVISTTVFMLVIAQKIPGPDLLIDMILEKEDLVLLITDVLLNYLRPFKCIAFICDTIYGDILQHTVFKTFGVYTSYITIFVEESEDLLSPYEATQKSLISARSEGCQFYVILVANAIQVSRFLKFGDRYRVLNTRANYLMLYDLRLFHKDLYYIWKRIVNVIFLREYQGIKKLGTSRKTIPWFEITTVPFPSPIKGILIPRRLDIWRESKYRTAVDLYRDKTSDLRDQTVRVVTFAHIPATTKLEVPDYKSTRTVMGQGNLGYAGIEIEILKTLSTSLNFVPDLYDPLNADVEQWGKKESDGQYTGLIGEMVRSRADIALGDLHYTPYLLNLMDLSIPYNTECLTFLTPESLTNNSWKTLILPFKPFMWAAILLCLVLIGIIFYALSRFHDEINCIIFKDLEERRNRLKRHNVFSKDTVAQVQRLTADEKYVLMKRQYELPKVEGEPQGLYLFGNLSNSVLYTYGMLLVVSLPKLPTGWSIRILTGWYLLYCTLVVVSYKASMTAILANPAPRVTIDTLQELINSKLPCGGWGEINREFFKTSLDSVSQAIGAKFETVNDSDEAIDRITRGNFAFYENVHYLNQASVRKQLKLQMARTYSNLSVESEKGDHNLHIMSDCVIHMPISIGLQKNSPIKPRVDKFIRRVLEAGLIKKWLDDVMQPTLNAQYHSQTRQSVKALMDMQKFFGAVVALLVGYFLSVGALLVEVVYFKLVIKKHPHYDKYLNHIVRKEK